MLPDIKKQYNALIVREKAAIKYLNDDKIPLKERERWMPAYEAICKQLNDLLAQIGSYSAENILDGFPEEIELFS